MAWVRFTESFIFTPGADRRTSVKYQRGRYNVTQECAAKAIASGKAEMAPHPPLGDKSGGIAATIAQAPRRRSRSGSRRAKLINP